MAGKIVGITIDIAGKTSGLVSSLKEADSQLSKTNSALKSVNSALKFDSSNMELLTSKSALLSDAIEQNSQKLDVLKATAEQAMSTLGQEGGATTEQIAELQAEISRTEQTLAGLETEAENTSSAMSGLSGDAPEEMGELSDNSEEAAGALEEVEEESNSSSAALDALGAVAGATGAAMAGAFAAAVGAAKEVGETLAGCTLAAGDYVDEINTLSQKTGVSTETLQEWNYVAGLIDVDVTTLTGSMTKLEKSMNSANEADSKYYETLAGLDEKLKAGKISQEEYNKAAEEALSKSASAYDQLGISVTDANGNLRNSEEVMFEVLQALSEMESGTERDLLSMELLGKSAKELGPLLQEGAIDQFKALSEEAHTTGYVLDSETFDAFQAFDDQMERLDKGATAAKNALGTVLLPTLNSLAGTGTSALNKFTLAMKDADGDISKISPAVSDILKEVLGEINKQAPVIFELIGTVVSTLAEIIIENLPMMIDSAFQIIDSLVTTLLAPDNLARIIDAALQIVLNLTNYILENIGLIMDAAIQIIVTVVKGIAQALPQLIPAAVDAILTICETLLAPENLALILDAALQLVIGLTTGIIDSLPQLIERLPEIITGIVDFLLSPEGVGQMISTGFDLFVAIVKDMPRITVELLTAVGGLIGDIIQKVITKGAEVFDAFRDMIPSLDDVFQWGKDMIDGIISGIQSAAGALWDACTDIAEGIADFLGFSVPEKGPLHEWAYNNPGADMVKLFDEGMESELPALQNSINLMASTIAGGVTPAAAPDYSGSLANINSGISQLAAAGAAPVYVSAYFGNDNFGTVVANANASNAFLSGGR